MPISRGIPRPPDGLAGPCPAASPARHLRVLLLAGLLVSPVAHAHYPHDVAHWVAVSPDPGVPRVATSLEQIDLDILGRSDNGLDWAARLVQATDDGAVASGAFLTPDRLILGTNRSGLLVSEDAGDTLVQAPTVSDLDITRVAASPAVMADGVAFAAGETAVWRTADGGLTWASVWETDGGGFRDLDVSPEFDIDGRACAVETDGVSCSVDGGLHWTRTAIPVGIFRISVGAGHRLWAAARRDGLYTSDDDGASWVVAAFEGDDVTTVDELDGGLVLVATADKAEWRSTDGGANWSEVEVAEIKDDQSHGGVNFFDFSQGPDGAIYFAAWPGLGRSVDDGLTYTWFNTEPIQNTHSVVLTEGADGAPWAWIGTYGGGPLLTDLGRHEAFVFPDLPLRFTRNTPVSLSWARDGAAIFDEGTTTWRTSDFGALWEGIAEHDSHDQDADVKGIAIAPDTSVDPFVVADIGVSAMSFQTSDDLGETWTVGTQDPQCAEYGIAATISPRWPDESRAWVSCGGAIYETTDRGESWFVIGDTGAFVFRIAEQTDGSVLVATSNGLWRMDGGTTTQLAFGGALVDSVAASTEPGDDTVFVLIPTEGWMRSDDGGANWTTLPAPTADLPRMVSMSPTFSTDGSVAVAGYGGAWGSTDRGDSWFPIYAMEVYEAGHDALRTSGDWAYSGWPGASGRGVDIGSGPGAAKSLDFRGVAVAVESPVDGPAGVAAISLDGGPAVEVSLPGAENVVWSADALVDTWHSLRVEVVEGQVAFDDVRITRLAVAPETGDTGGDTGEDTGGDTGEDTGNVDSGVDSGDDTGVDSGVDTDDSAAGSDDDTGKATGCGCAAAGGDLDGLAVAVSALLWTRRRRTRRVSR